MVVCQGCQREKSQAFYCSRCHSAAYCSKDCQRAAWPDHKQICAAPANASSRPGSTTQLGVLLGEAFSAKSCQIPRNPSTAVVRHLFNKHKESRDSAFKDVLMPVSDRLFGRPMHIIYDTQPASRLQPNTFATRDTCNLQTGLGPNIRGQVGFVLLVSKSTYDFCRT